MFSSGSPEAAAIIRASAVIALSCSSLLNVFLIVALTIQVKASRTKKTKVIYIRLAIVACPDGKHSQNTSGFGK